MTLPDRLAGDVMRYEALQAYTLPPALAAPPTFTVTIPGPSYLDKGSPPLIFRRASMSANSTFTGLLRDPLFCCPTIVFTHFDGSLYTYTAPVHDLPVESGGAGFGRINAWPAQGQAVFESGRLGLRRNFIQAFPDHRYDGSDSTGRDGAEKGVNVRFVETKEG